MPFRTTRDGCPLEVELYHCDAYEVDLTVFTAVVGTIASLFAIGEGTARLAKWMNSKRRARPRRVPTRPEHDQPAVRLLQDLRRARQVDTEPQSGYTTGIPRISIDHASSILIRLREEFFRDSYFAAVLTIGVLGLLVDLAVMLIAVAAGLHFTLNPTVPPPKGSLTETLFQLQSLVMVPTFCAWLATMGEMLFRKRSPRELMWISWLILLVAMLAAIIPSW